MVYNSWHDVFKEIEQKDYFKRLMLFVNEEYKNKVIYPKKEDMRNAFKFTPFNEVKVVIIGQDPYPNPNQAMGLAFSVNKGIKLPPSLRNIYQEIINEFKLNRKVPLSGDLTYLAKQGVLLLNNYLTVEAHKPLSHEDKDYDKLFIDILKILANKTSPIVYLLWGNKAKKYGVLLKNNPRQLVIETNHPSPLSANQGGWFNSMCFIKTNNFLRENGLKEIDWLDDEK